MIPFVFLTLLVVIVTALFFKAGKTRRWCIVAAIFLLPAFLMPVTVLRKSVVNIQQTSGDNPSYIESAPIWTERIEDQFEADVYPSEPSAKRAVRLRTKGLAGVNLNTVILETLSVPAWSSRPGSNIRSGRVEATVGSGNEETTIIASFVEKPWVENFANFVNRNPENKWILSSSQHSCTSQAEAEREAMHDACGKIAGLLNYARQRRSGLIISHADIRNGGFIADKFVQSFDGSAGRIWRQAVLINASQDKLANLVDKKMLTRQSWRARWIRELISVAGITILICAVYLFLNAATRGYYTWSLRIAAVVLVLAGILLVFTLS